MNKNNCDMGANSGLKEEEIELELGLSIGGSYRRQNSTELKSDTPTFDTGSRKKLQTLIRSSVSGQEITDPKTKREIHALRRQESKNKREEKQLKKGGFCKGYFNGGQVINNRENVNNNNGIWLKAKAFQSKESEIENEEPECKKSKTEYIGSDHNDSNKVNLILNIDQNNNGTCYSSPCTSSPVLPAVLPVLPAVLPVQYGHPPLQHGLPAHGFVYPCANLNIMPCWFTAGEERNLVQVQPVVSYGFVPFQAASYRDHNLGNGYDSEQNGSHDGGNTKARSNESPVRASSMGSDLRSSSHEVGGSSDTRSRSSPIPEQSQLNNDSKENDAKGQSEHSATSQLTGSTRVENKLVQCSQIELEEEAKVEAESNITNKQILTRENPFQSMDRKSDLGKPPKPQTQNHSNPSLPYMPCVSTTGNGPNAKTINGFLYRYTKTEVSIICVCHGSSFSPAEFVQHAGGTDVAHPLKHITVIPSAF